MREKDECNWIMRDPQEESLRIDTVRVSSEKKPMLVDQLAS